MTNDDTANALEDARGGSRRKMRTLVIPSSLVALVILGVVVWFGLGDENGDSRDDPSTTAKGAPADVLPDGIKVLDKNLTGGEDPLDGNREIYDVGVVFENTSDVAVTMSVGFSFGAVKASSGEATDTVDLYTRSSSSTFITVMPNGEAGYGESFEIPNWPTMGQSDEEFIQVRAETGTTKSGGSETYLGTDQLVVDDPEARMTAKVLSVQEPGTVEFEVTNDFETTVLAATIGMVFYLPNGDVAGGWLSSVPNKPWQKEQSQQGYIESVKAEYAKGKSRHTMHVPVDSKVEEASDIKVFIWP